MNKLAQIIYNRLISNELHPFPTIKLFYTNKKIWHTCTKSLDSWEIRMKLTIVLNHNIYIYLILVYLVYLWLLP